METCRFVGHFFLDDRGPECHHVEGWMGPKAGLGVVEKKCISDATIIRTPSTTKIIRLFMR
jgi:hypothetical protein